MWHQGTVYEATATVVPFIALIATDSGTVDRADLVNLLTAIADGSSYAEVHRNGTFHDLQDELLWARQARSAVAEWAPRLADTARDQPRDFRVAVAALLSSVPEVGSKYTGYLRDELDRAPTQQEQQAFAAALAALGNGSPRARQVLSDLKASEILESPAAEQLFALLEGRRAAVSLLMSELVDSALGAIRRSVE